ncbi:MAG TPA: type VI secretion system contractile sheath large subunit, partial [Longimicrobium sp.]
MPETEAAAGGAATATEDVTVLDRIVREGRMARDPVQLQIARGLVGEYATQVLDQHIQKKENLAAAIQERIAEIDQIIGEQLNAILHDAQFQKLEATWRGMFY